MNAPLSIRTLKTCLILLGYIYAVVGTWLFWDPVALFIWLDIEQNLPVNVLSEIRSAYGGTYLFMGGFMLWAALTGAWMRGALMVAFITSAGHMIGRVGSFMLDGAPDSHMYGSVFLETLVAVYSGAMLLGSKVPK